MEKWIRLKGENFKEKIIFFVVSNWNYLFMICLVTFQTQVVYIYVFKYIYGEYLTLKTVLSVKFVHEDTGNMITGPCEYKIRWNPDY